MNAGTGIKMQAGEHRPITVSGAPVKLTPQNQK
jgi:hypothetical protein